MAILPTKGLLLSAIISAPVAWSAITGAALAETLEETLVSAYLTNPSLSAQQSSLRATDEGVAQARSNWRPTIEFSADAGREINKSSLRTSSARTQHRTPYSYGIDLSQPIYRGGRTLAETSEAENAVQAARVRLIEVEQDILLAAATAYLDVYRDEAVLELNRNNESVLQRQLEATRDRFQVGEITRTDVHQAEARLARSTADRIQSEATLEGARAAFRNATGRAPKGQINLPPLPSGSPADIEAALKEAALNNPRVIAAQYNERAAANNVDSVWGELLPEVEFTASMSRDHNSSSESSQIDSAEALFTLNVPLYQSGAVYSRLRAAKQQVSEQRMTIELERRNAIEQATRSWETLQSAKARVSAFRTAIQAATIAFEGVEREAAVGSRTVLDVLDAEQELLDARVNFIRAQRDEAVGVFELLSAMGQLGARNLQLPVDLYNPENHYQEVRDKWAGATSSGGID